MYNHDVIGTRYNPARDGARSERRPAGSKRNGGSPPGARRDEIGVIHATPSVVNGYVYFGTATAPGVLQADARRQGPLDLPSQPGFGRQSPRSEQGSALPVVG